MTFNRIYEVNMSGGSVYDGQSYEFNAPEFEKAIHQGRRFLPNDSVKVYGDVVLRNLSDEALPGRLKVTQTLTIVNCPNVVRLPKELTVEETLCIHGLEKLKALPEHLNVGGNFELGSCPMITELPKSLEKIGWNSYVSKFLRDKGMDYSDYARYGGDIQVTDCYGLKQIPEWIFQLGPKRKSEQDFFEGPRRCVTFANTGIDSHARNIALNTPHPGVDLHIYER